MTGFVVEHKPRVAEFLVPIGGEAGCVAAKEKGSGTLYPNFGNQLSNPKGKPLTLSF